LNRVQHLLAAGAAVIGLIGLTGTSANAAEASSGEPPALTGDVTALAVDTPDGHRVYFSAGYIEWNDYDNSDHSIDYDDVWVQGYAGDGKTLSVRAVYNGEGISASVGDGSRKTISFSTNVTDGTGPTVYIAILNDGEQESATYSEVFIE
jgi:hypothetical protein